MKSLFSVIILFLGYSGLLQAQSANSPELPKSIKTVVVPKAVSNSKPEWDVYTDISMEVEAWNVVPGDTVEVVGWAPRLFKIRKGKERGYVSRLSLEITEALKPLAETIETQTPILEEIEMKKLEAKVKAKRQEDSLRVAKYHEKEEQQLAFWKPAIAVTPPLSSKSIREKMQADSLDLAGRFSALHLSVSKKELAVGECALVELTFFVREDNLRPLQFPNDLLPQLWRVTSSFPDSLYWTGDEGFDTIGEERRVGSHKYIAYQIYRTAVCPVSSGPITFNPVELILHERILDLVKLKLKDESEFNLAPYKTEPLTIRVKPLAAQQPRGQFSLTGNFVLLDKIFSKDVVTGKPVRYSVTVMGNGMTFPLDPPVVPGDSIDWQLDDEQISDTIINDQYYSRKTFFYTLTFKKRGDYNLSSYLNFKAFNPNKNEGTTINSTTTVMVTGKDVKVLKSRPLLRQSILAIDFSQSMDIEDYKPSRLGVVKKGVADFLVKEQRCDVGLIIFGGNVHSKNVATGDSCVSKRKIRALSNSELNPGTAIGDAIWTATRKIDKSGPIKKIVVIGDGDNTAGYFSTSSASRLAKEKNIAVYTIGVGTPGLAVYGRDANGKPQMVENTFTDIEFKKIAARTGGKYFLAKDAADVTRILKKIFSE